METTSSPQEGEFYKEFLFPATWVNQTKKKTLVSDWRCSGLSISSVRRPGLSKLAPGLAKSALNKSSGLARPYLSNH